MDWKKAAALFLAALTCVFCLAGCEEELETAAPPVVIKNNGKASGVVLGELAQSQERTAVLREIADKYQADFPNTEIEIRTFSSAQELEKALKAGEVDIAEVESENQAAYVRQGLLMNLSPYLPGWDESSTLTPAAKLVAGTETADGCSYLIPNDVEQDILFYRVDWVRAHNTSTPEEEHIYCRTWGQMLNSFWRLGEKGKIAFAGRDKLVNLFDAMVWSAVGMRRIAVDSNAYFHSKTATVFSLESAGDGVEQFRQVIEELALPEAVNWTKEEAVQAFCDGEAAVLLADRSVMAQLRASMPENAWAGYGFPRGVGNTAVFSLNSFQGWGISAAAEKAGDWENAFHFLTFLSNADNNTHYAKVCGALPIHVEAADLEEFFSEGDFGPETEMLAHPDWYFYVSRPTMFQACEGYEELADEKVRQFLNGGLSQSELLDWMDEYWSAALAEEGPAPAAGNS